MMILPEKVREALHLFSELVFMARRMTRFVFAWPVIRDLQAFDQRSQSAEIPLYVKQALIPVGFAIMAFLVLVRLPPAASARHPRNRAIDRATPRRGKQHRCRPSWPLRPATVLLVIGFPIFLVLLVTCLVIVLFVADVPTDTIQTFLFSGLDNFPLLAVPFFVLAGEIMAQGGIAKRVVIWVMSLIGGVRGSLGVTTVAASELLGAMAHTAVGTIVAVGRMIHPSLRENGYNERFAVRLIASSGAIAVVIPPSIAIILYSVSAQQSAVAL